MTSPPVTVRDPSRQGVRASGRQKAFSRAHSHSAIVKALKIGFPVLSLVVVAGYGALLFNMAGIGDKVATLPMPHIVPENIVMQKPRYHDRTNDGGDYVVTAESAKQSLVDSNLVSLKGILATFTDGSRQHTRMTSKSGIMNSRTNVTQLYGGIRVRGDNGLRATLERATVHSKEGFITSYTPVFVETRTATVRSRRMTLRQKLHEATFAEDVRTHLAGSAAPSPSPADTDPLFGNSRAPIDIVSNRLDINDTAHTAIFSGSVSAIQGDSTLTTPEMTVLYEGGGALGGADNPAQREAGGPAGSAAAPQPAKVKHVATKEPVVIKRANGDVVTGKTGEFDAVASQASVIGDVVVTSLPDRRATGDRADFDQTASTVTLTGVNVVVTQGENVLKGRRLVSERATGRTHLASPATNGQPAGRIAAHFRKQNAAPTKAKPASNDGSDSPATGVVSGQFKTDPNAPIDVESDVLDVDDPAKVATFQGGTVTAKQGTMTLQSLKIKAHYTGAAGLAGSGTDAKASGSAAGGQKTGAAEITIIEAEGAVVITSADGQTATGDWARFDVKANKGVVGGSDVVLIQGENVAHGNRLDIDLATGDSVLKMDAPATAEASGSSEVVTGKPGKSRPTAILFPNQAKEKVKEKFAPEIDALKSAAKGSGGPAPNSNWEMKIGP